MGVVINNNKKKLGQRAAFCVASEISVDSDAMADESLGGMVFDAEKITKRRLRKSKIEYLVKWKGRDGKELNQLTIFFTLVSVTKAGLRDTPHGSPRRTSWTPG